MTKSEKAFETVQKCIGIFGVASAVVLAIVVATAATGGAVSTFMWIRSALLLAITLLLRRLAVQAAEGARTSFERLKTVTTVLPIAVVVVDLIPGVCPVWYAAMQGFSVLPLIAVAVMIRRRALSDAFPANA
jgi:hypothetical protein